MSETKSTSVSLDVFSTRMTNCQVVYPHRIIRPLKKFRVDHHEQLAIFVHDILLNSGNIDQYVADNLKRAESKGTLCHSAAFPCEYCFSKGVRNVVVDPASKTKKHLKAIREKLENLNESESSMNMINNELEKAEKMIGSSKRSHIVWPHTTANGEPRTTQKVLEILDKIDASETGKIPPDEAKGVVRRSPLLDIPGFNFTMDSPTEYLHAVCLGVSKRMVCLTFSVGENRPRITKRKLSSALEFNSLMLMIKVPREFPRRIRDLDFSLFKGQQYRNITIFFFPVVISCIEKSAKERKLWLLYAYMIRSCVLPQKEFQQVDLSSIEKACFDFYVLYEKLFGCYNCSYNTHIVCSHLLEMRTHGPLTFTSAFGFESFYGEIRNSFTPGTQSTLKQIFQRILLRRSLSHHCCENTIYFSDHDTCLENNTLIYTFQNSEHKMYKICEVQDDRVICLKQGRYIHTFQETQHLDFSKVGVYRRGPMSSEKCTIQKKDIAGKVLIVENLLITCPNNVLREK